MAAMSRELISEEEGLIRLLTPPFVNTPNDPGYIKGYVAGVRENGGQYTHAACWAVKAVAEHGENRRALRLLEMLAPVSHALTAEAADRYKVEPYVMAADVYGAAPHVGRGGWTWYTGSSGWMYRVAIESILGLRIENGDTLVLCPCIPNDWPRYRVTLKRPVGGGICEIVVENPRHSAQSIASAEINGRPLPVSGRTIRIPLGPDVERQRVRIVLE
jgi:cyclic beta-1,2-glucan synthetase